MQITKEQSWIDAPIHQPKSKSQSAGNIEWYLARESDEPDSDAEHGAEYVSLPPLQGLVQIWRCMGACQGRLTSPCQSVKTHKDSNARLGLLLRKHAHFLNNALLL